MAYKIILTIILTLLLGSFVSATDFTPLNDNLIAFWQFNNNNFSDSINVYDGNNFGTTNVTGKVLDGRLFNSVNDYITIDNANNLHGEFTSSWTMQFWLYPIGTNSNKMLFSLDDGSYAGSGALMISTQATNYGFRVYDGNSWVLSGDQGFTENEWQMLTLVHNDSSGYLSVYRNDVYKSQGLMDNHVSPSSGQTAQFNSINFDSMYGGRVDVVGVWDKALTLEDITLSYNSGVGKEPPFINVTAIETLDSVESTAVVKQTGTTTLIGVAPQTIVSSTYNISLNDTELYGGYYFNVLSNLNNNLFCELYIDGTVVSNVSRSNTAGVVGDVFIMSTHFEQDEGNHSQMLECSKIGGGQIIVSNAIGIGHIMRNENGSVIPHSEVIISDTVTSGSTFTEIGEFNLTIGDYNSSDKYHSIVVEGMLTYTNNDASEEVLSTYIEINNEVNCSTYPRTVGSGNTGSVSVDCILENVTIGQTYNIEVFANGTNAEYQGNIIAKNFFLSDDEIAGGQGALVGLTWSGTSETKLFNLTGGNLHHANTNVFQKASYSIITNDTTTINTYVKMYNGNTWQTVNFTRGFEANKIGVLIGHDIFENIPIANYTLEVWATCGENVLCEMVGGSSLGYITDVTTTILNAINITAVNTWNNGTINEFTVTNGATLTTTTGSVLYFTSKDYENFTINSSNYFSTYYLNYNTSNNLEGRLNQSIIRFACYDTNGYKVTCLNDTINPLAGTYEWFTEAQYEAGKEYYTLAGNYTVNVLDEKTINLTGFFNNIIHFADDITFTEVNDLVCTYNNTEYLSQPLHVSTYGGVNRNLSCSKLFYYPTFSYILDSIQQNITYNISEFKLKLFFDASVNGSITDVTQSQTFSNTTIILKQSTIPIGPVTIRWTNQATNITQIMEYYNDKNTTLEAYLHAETEVLNTYRTIRLESDSERPEDARVVAEYWNGTDYLIAYGELSDAKGEVNLDLVTDREYRITVQAEGYVSQQQLISTNENDDTVVIIGLVASTSKTDSTFISNCNGILTNTETCYYQVICGSNVCSTVGINYTITYEDNTTFTGSAIKSTTTGNTFAIPITDDITDIVVTSRIDDIPEDTLSTSSDYYSDRTGEQFITDTIIKSKEESAMVWMLFILISGIVMGAVFQKKIKKDIGIYVTMAYFILFGALMPMFLGLALLIALIKIGLYLMQRTNS